MNHNITDPASLDDFFASDYEESSNPFIMKRSRSWGNHVALWGASVAALFLLISYICHYSSNSPALSALSSFFLLFVYFFAGTAALIRSLQNIRDLNINIQVLMTLAAFLSVLIGSELEGGLLLVLFSLSEALEEGVTKKTKSALHALHKLTPSTAYLIEEDGSILPCSVREVGLNALILVKAYETVPLDGTIVTGGAFVNLAQITGESTPISKQPGDFIPAGSSPDSPLTIRVEKTSADSTLAKIIHLITKASATKPHLQKLLDRFGKPYATTVILLALFFALSLPLILSIPYLGYEGSIYRALAFLIAASPCALIIATPTAYLSAISACARKGILLKGGVILDALARCTTLTLDKTGTITTGRLALATLEQDGSGFSTEEAVAIAAGLETYAVHPIAEALVRHAETTGITPSLIERPCVLAGKGIEGFIQHNGEELPVSIGQAEYVLTHIKDSARRERIKKMLTHQGHVVTLLLIGHPANATLFVFHFIDDLRPGVATLIQKLKKHLDVIMLTGDHQENADHVAKKVGITKVYAGLTPEDKFRIVSNLVKERSLIMVGDGTNDAAALTAANVGIAMGLVGSGIAIESADIVLLRDDLSLISWIFKRSKSTLTVVKQNLALSFLVITIVGAASISGLIPLWLAVIFHEGSTIVVALNSLRLLRP